ncbi:MAG: hypothetical protein RL189_1696 [Pseudomonadota bacterium]
MGAESVNGIPLQRVNESAGFWRHPLFSLIWSAARLDVVFGLLLSPLHALTEVALGFATGALLQLIFVSSEEANLLSILPRQVADFFPSLASVGPRELTTLVPASLVVIGFVRLLTSFGSNYLLERAGHRVAHALRAGFLNSYLHTSGRVLDRRNPDELTNRILLDTTLMQSMVSKGTIGALRDGLVVIAAAASMLVVASQFFAVLILIFVPFFLLLRGVSRRLEFYTRESARRQVSLSTRALQMRNGLLPIFAIGAQGREYADISHMSDDYYSFIRKSFFLRTVFRPAMEIVAVGVLAGALLWRLNLGPEADVAAYSTLFVLAALSFRPLKNVSSFVSQFAELKAVWLRLSDEWIKTRASVEDESLKLTEQLRPSVALAVQDVAYDSHEGKRILFPCSLEVKSKSRFALVGESGAGKSTLLRLMAGLLPPSQGVVSGTQNALLATQTPYVFQGTVFDNIVYPLKLTKNSEIQIARERAKVLIMNLMLAHTQAGAELFLNKKVGFMGEGLSGGERARVALARLLYADRPVLLLDEPTANLDKESAAAFWNAVWKWQRQAGESRTVVAVTHHWKDLGEFDECCVFSNGKIIARGSAAEILAQYPHQTAESSRSEAMVERSPT